MGTSLSSAQLVNSRCRGRTTSPGKVVVSDSETAELNIRMAQQHQKVSKYTFAQLCQAVEELKKLTEQLNDNSKSLDLRLMLLEGKKLPSQLDSVERGTDDVGDHDREVPMSTSERAIQKEAKLIAEKEKEKGKLERAKDEKAEPRKNGQLVEKQVKVLPN